MDEKWCSPEQSNYYFKSFYVLDNPTLQQTDSEHISTPLSHYFYSKEVLKTHYYFYIISTDVLSHFLDL